MSRRPEEGMYYKKNKKRTLFATAWALIVTEEGKETRLMHLSKLLCCMWAANKKEKDWPLFTSFEWKWVSQTRRTTTLSSP